MKINKKLSAAITLSLMLGVYGSASAGDSLYGAQTGKGDNTITQVTPIGAATTVVGDATNTGANYTVNGGTWDNIFGAYATDSAKAENNKVTVQNASINESIHGVRAPYRSEAKDNEVTVEGSTVDQDIIGASSNYKDSINNSVRVSNTYVSNDKNLQCYVSGGIAAFANTSGNSAIIDNNSIINGDVSGGRTGTDGNYNSIGNTVSIKNSYIGYKKNSSNEIVSGTKRSVYGGCTENGTASDNEVTISQTAGNTTKINGNVYGGYTKDGTAGVTINDDGSTSGAGNIVSIKGAGASATDRVQINGYVCGGYSQSGAANGNKVGYMNGTTLGAATNFTAAVVYGGYGTTGAASNEVWLGEGAKVAKGVVGGIATNGNATSNEVWLGEGAEVAENVYGGYTQNRTAGGTGTGEGNTVSITGSATAKVKIGYIDSYDDIVAGGYVYGGQSENGEANGNKVGSVNSSGEFGAATNFRAKAVIGGQGTTGVANNKVYLGTGVKVDYDVYGGNLCDGVEGEVYAAQDNIVTINSDATVSYNVYGGYVSADVGNAIRNTVNISGNSDIDKSVYGGRIGDYSAGNANYNIVNVSGGKMSAVEGGFTLNGNAVENHVNVTGGKMLSITGGFAGRSYVSNNIVDISGIATVVDYGVEGGVIWYGKAINNKAIVTGGTIGTDVFGGEVMVQGDATGNVTSISSGMIGYIYDETLDKYVRKIVSDGNETGNVYGGYTEKGTAGGTVEGAGNIVSITGGTIGGNVYGGESEDGAAIGNKVGYINSSGEFEAATNFTAKEVYGGKGTTGAEGNEVHLGTGAEVKKDVYGGYATNSNAKDNTVQVVGTASINGKLTGGYVFRENSSTELAADGNKVIIKNVSSVPSTYGGYVWGGGIVRNNEVSITTSSGNNVYGGYIAVGGLKVKKTGNVANGNKVNVAKSNISGNVYGSFIQISEDYLSGSESTVVGNEVNVSGATSITGDVYGAWTRKGEAFDNKVTLSGGEVGNNVYGGYTMSGTAGYSKDTDGNIVGTGNIVSIAGTDAEHKVKIGTYDSAGKITAGGNVYGGESANGEANGNKVGTSATSAASNFTAKEVYGGKGTTGAEGNEVWLGAGAEVTCNVNGGFTQNGNAETNSVTISGGTIGTEGDSNTGYVFGGKVNNEGHAKGNIVTITDGTVYSNSAVIGGMTYKGTAGGESTTDGNKVSISGGTVNGVYGGSVSYEGNAQNNSVEISQAGSTTTRIKGNVYGGSSRGNNAIVKDNTVTVTGGTLEKDVNGGWTENGTVKSNTAVVSGGAVNGSVYGGYAENGTAGGTETNAGNTVTITSGSISGNVYGGKVGDYNESTHVSYGEGDAIGNLVSATGGTVTGKIYGGFTPKGAANNNTVEISGANKVGDYVIGARSYGTDKDSTADNNIVKIKDSSVGIVVVGGRGFSAKNNSVTIDNTSVASGGSWVAGGISGVSASDSSEGTQDNTVTILGASQIKTTVYGGYSNWNADPSSNNSVSIKGASATSKAEVMGVNGGFAIKGIARGNKVGFIDEAGKLVAATNFTTDNNFNIRGGRGYAGAQDNEVQLGDGVEANGSVYGGIAIEGSADSNKVTISGDAKVKENVYGGNVDKEGDARSNEVSITGGEVTGSVYGGWTENGTAGGTDAGNTVSINGATERVQIDGNVKGGYTKAGTAIGNKVGTSTNAATNFKAKYVYGGHAITGAEGNEVHLGEGVEVTRDVRGGYTETGAADRNIVTINGNSGNIAQLDDVFGGYGATANKNEVHLGTGVVVTSEVYGGNAVSGTANSNIVNISGDANVKTADIYGGKGKSTGTGNTLNIDTWSGKAMKSISDFQAINVKDTKDIEAGSADGLADGAVALDIQYAKLDTEAAALVAGNEIVFINTNGSDDFSKKFNSAKLNGIELGDGIWRAKKTGFGVDASKAEFQINDKKAFVGVTDVLLTGNLVDEDVDEELVLGSSAAGYDNIYGAYSAKGTATAATVKMAVDNANLSSSTVWGNNVSAAGNTLNVKAVGVKVKALKNFENINFYIPATAKARDTMVDVKEAVNLTGVNVAAGFHNETALGYGDKVKLINAPAVSGMDGVNETKVDDTDYTKYDVNIYQADADMNLVDSGATSLVAELVNSELTENAKSLVETMAAGTAILADGSDMLAGASFENAASAIRADVEQGAPSGSMSIFGTVSGNKSTVKSGSYVDVKGWNFNLGAAKELVNKSGKLIFAPVVEYGRGSYDSYLDNGYHGEGKTKYVGGGLMAKQSNKGGSYFEGSVRAGKLSADYESTGGNYDSDSMYLAAHLGLGKVVKLSEKNSLDYYGKYFYSRQGSDDTTLTASGKSMDLHFDAVESHRTRLGGRFNHALGETNTVYAGLAWQHEFSSTARATLDGMGTPAPSMKGDSGILELGVKVSEADKYDLDFGVNGSIGKKKGAGLSLNFNWKF